MPKRFLHLIKYIFMKAQMKFYCRPLKPNYEAYRIIDADARWHMDPFDAILWFRSRGDQVLSHSTLVKAFLIRSGTLVVEVRKA